MKFTNEEIRTHLLDWVKRTNQTEVRFLLHYCLGYYGYITKQIMAEIDKLVSEDILSWKE